MVLIKHVWSLAPSWLWPHAEAGFSHWIDNIICTTSCQLQFPVSFLFHLRGFTLGKIKKISRNYIISPPPSCTPLLGQPAHTESAETPHWGKKQPNKNIQIKNSNSSTGWEENRLKFWAGHGWVELTPGGGLGYRPAWERDQAKLWHPARAGPATSSQM